ncbi:unnamed protein product [Cyclocybe aegerita]|uniref:BHLH domain-containing protein n=1 Tax=Cyclocybe aegerita TaxID=1973307 RepID=A0A8S0W0H6_CYCAE|nr:unnamed protein product [Cyclocybe aegerita]
METDHKDDDWPTSSSSTTSTSIWSDAPSLKSYSDMMDFASLDSAMGLGGLGGIDMGMGIDMDFNPMTLEPTGGMGLHQFDPLTLSLGFAPGQQGFANFGFEDQFGSADGLGFGFQLQSLGQTGPSSSSVSSTSVFSESEASTKERRLSITSTSSSSAGSLASLSPMPESLPSPSPAPGYASTSASASPPVHPKEEPVQSPGMEGMEMDSENPFADLANIVRQTTGVTLAVPMTGLAAAFPLGTPQQAKSPQQTSKKPHSETTSGHVSTTSSAASTPPPSTPTSSMGSPFAGLVVNTSAVASASVSQVPTPTMPTSGSTTATAQPRPKTSHTTIERRYRTNLNARIQSLRMAVPALRVLEDGVKEGVGSKKIKKNVRGGVIVKSASGTGIGIGVGVDAEEVDIIDERGFVDGVKVARKCSKANVLGKAVEYIKVLKRREKRLKAEQAGLKTLVSGLVGGPALVREWERQWRERFGGEERDEVEGEMGGEGADDGDDEDSEEEDDEEETGKKRKRAKVAPKKPAEKKDKKSAVSAQPPVVLLQGEGAVVSSGAVPEKRKRGRPRKVVPAPVTLAPIPPADGPKAEDVPTPFTAGVRAQWAVAQGQAQGPQPQQYLLAVFALFSFFNSPLTSSSSASATHHHTGTVLSAVHPPLAYAPEIVAQFVSPSPVAMHPTGWAWKEYVQLFHLLVSLCVLASFVASWIGFTFGKSGVEGVAKRGRGLSVASFLGLRASSEKEREKKRSGLKGWVGLAMDSVLEGDAASLTYFERSQIYGAISTKRRAPASELVTLALVRWSDNGIFGRFSRMRAQAIWGAAKAQVKFSSSTKAGPQKDGKTYQSLVFETIPDVEDSVRRLAAATKADGVGESRAYDPLEVLGVLVVKERIKKHLGKMFVNAVGAHSGDPETEERDEEEIQWRRTIDAARELGGGVEALAKTFERVWKTSCTSFDGASEDHIEDLRSDIDSDDGEIQALMTALVLFRRVFASPAASDVECSSAASSVTMTPTARERESAAHLLMSPPPSPDPSRPARPGVKADERRLQTIRGLRRALGHPVFEELGLGDGADDHQQDTELGLEDARDRIVDLIVDVERRERIVA